MKKNIKMVSVIAVFILALSVGFVGCRAAERPFPDDNNNNTDLNRNGTLQDENRLDNTTEDGILDNNNGNNDRLLDRDMNRNTTDNDMAVRADRIRDRINKLSGVSEARVFISGATAVVGVDLGDKTDGRITTDLKRKIEDTVREADNNIQNVSVTADPDLFERIGNVVNEVGRGRPLSGLGTEIEEIIRRITPTM